MMRLLLLLVLGAGALPARAQLEFAKTAIVAETTPHQQKVKASFAFRNTGTKPVTIVNIQTTCGCTTAQLDQKTYAPGTGGAIAAELTIGASAGTGKIEKKVLVKTDDPAHAVYTLVIGALVPAYLTLEPLFLKWESGADPTPKSISLKVGDPFVIRVTQVTSSNPAWTTAVKTVKDGAAYELIVTPPPNTAVASRTALTIMTDFPQEQPLQFAASARVTQPRAKPKTNWLPELFR